MDTITLTIKEVRALLKERVNNIKETDTAQLRADMSTAVNNYEFYQEQQVVIPTTVKAWKVVQFALSNDIATLDNGDFEDEQSQADKVMLMDVCNKITEGINELTNERTS